MESFPRRQERGCEVSDTPRTDAVCFSSDIGGMVVNVEFARTLERTQAKLIQDWADTDTAVRETCRKAGIDVDGTTAYVPDIPELVERLAKENAKLRAASPKHSHE